MMPKNPPPEKHDEDRTVEALRWPAIPNWVPDAVAKVAPFLPGPTHTQRLLGDNRMNTVWRELRKRAPNDLGSKLTEDERDDLHSLMESADLLEQDVLGPDKACVAFFMSIAWIVWNPSERHVGTRAQADEQASQLETAADCCRWVAGEPMFAKHRVAAAEMATFFQNHAVSLKNQGYLANLDPQIKPYVLNRSSGSRGDDKIRGYTRAIAVIVCRIFGSFSYGTVATVATVALEEDIDQKSVENWCKDLRTDL
jgi:hypothetical protein